MKTILSGISALMLIGLIIATVIYQQTLSKASLIDDHDTEEGKATDETDLQEDENPTDSLVANETVDYAIENEQLFVTYNKGIDWIHVPIEKHLLFAGDYNGREDELIPQSYILSKERTVFLHPKGERSVGITYSLNKGKSWQTSVIVENYPAIRFRKVAFLNDDFGYTILSGSRTMSQEASSVYLTFDGGKSWRQVSRPNTARMIANGGFIDESTGFLSYGTINPEAPELYVTKDTAQTWKQAKVHVPDKYKLHFVTAETPKKVGDHLIMLVQQGPNGDYKGGKVKGKFKSTDGGETWKFVSEVESVETE
ncbi:MULTISPECIES: oxidoreductase [Clostridia]|uniref:WD40/YVTN/BNR-like repeat-containing protein n=1 Tax=Clostridia TaxID=186801 RepID=UPI000EA3878E|nr:MULTISPECIES: oxidoreductase [Clostridia]NBJ69939.1 oxidoreductase [Roseburia sp. 1XD42-34]RKI77511.1 oxidoreductase [Clostridium sp. 1xD42-85]